LVDGDVVPIGEVEQQRDAATAESGLEAAGLVVETGVDDTGVVAGLMGGRVVFLVEDRDVGAVMTHEDLARHGRADDSGTDHGPACGCHVSTSPLDDLTLRLYSARTNTAIGVRSVVVALPMVVISNAFEIWRSKTGSFGAFSTAPVEIEYSSDGTRRRLASLRTQNGRHRTEGIC